jgi:hypothetical protein
MSKLGGPLELWVFSVACAGTLKTIHKLFRPTGTHQPTALYSGQWNPLVTV